MLPTHSSQAAVLLLCDKIGIEVSETVEPTDAYAQMVDYIEQLADENFNTLVALLYRLDISEDRVRLVIMQNPGVSAGKLITDLMIEREQEKIISRAKYKQR